MLVGSSACWRANFSGRSGKESKCSSREHFSAKVVRHHFRRLTLVLRFPCMLDGEHTPHVGRLNIAMWTASVAALHDTASDWRVTDFLPCRKMMLLKQQPAGLSAPYLKTYCVGCMQTPSRSAFHLFAPLMQKIRQPLQRLLRLVSSQILDTLQKVRRDVLIEVLARGSAVCDRLFRSRRGLRRH